MNKLISIKPYDINNQEVNTVNARELHDFLELSKDFSTWIKARIEKYEFQENIDYLKTAENRLPKIGELGKPSFQDKIDTTSPSIWLKN